MSQPSGFEEVYGPNSIPMFWLRGVQIVTGTSLALTAVVVVSYFRETANARCDLWMQTAWIWWVVAPPIWFSIEYFYLFKKYQVPGAFEALKYGQDVASKVWLAIAAVLTAIVPKLH